MDLKEEQNLFALGYKLIGGLDEAGRGPLAGPVAAACVICKYDHEISPELIKEVKDSKKLSEKKREKLFGLIYENVFEVGVGTCDQETIDRINILEATFLAMKKAIGSFLYRERVWHRDVRADVITILVSKANKTARIRHYENIL